ncbi:phage tail spike protein [Metabacillus halosaccharovorans]|uniref:Phage tail protein n=1 Tax=Metabacillus halosaccharovorans TaxID=930124 RepID=A0ABT3DCI3_9BACI|nr:phage tail spike protein [Metabacillus halosaccharovorans]MCV9884696.1 phage tail protein [Metabacillus halosaccharovorans]
MYKVTIINDGIETTIHSPNVDDLKLPTGQIKKEINLIDSFNFSFYMNNPGFGKLKPLKTLINVLNLKTGKYEFEGRILGPSENMDDTGLYDASYLSEGELGYLHDSQQRHLEFRGTPIELFTTILNYHNSQVESSKHFHVGNVTVTNSTNNLYLYLSAEVDTFDTIKDKLIDTLGGELQIRKENGVRFLDLLDRVGEDKNTEIKIAKNLLSISRDVDPTQIITRLTPLGTRIESTEEGATDASEARLTIETVNNGIPYIDSPTLISEFGIQGGSVTWDDVTLPNNLMTKGNEWFANQKISHVQYQISALDLFLLGLDIDNFNVGNSHPVKNSIMGIDERLRIIGKSLDIKSPQNAALTIGDKFKTLNQYQSDMNKSAQQVVELQNTVSRQSQTIGVLKTELSTVNDAVITIQSTLEENDIPALEQAVTDLQEAINNLNAAVDEIPDYQVVTPTTDGLMSSLDKSKLDLIAVISSVDLDNFKQKLDLITVANAINLDQLEARVTNLEGGQSNA